MNGNSAHILVGMVNANYKFKQLMDILTVMEWALQTKIIRSFDALMDKFPSFNNTA